MEKTFWYKGSDVVYNISGKGQPVVLLHGFAEDSSVWKEQVASLQPHCLLILPDLPGSGKSAMLQQENITMEDYAGCISALLENENISSCILSGHSMGGYITIAFAEKYQSKLTGFGFVHSTAFADSEDKKTARKKGIKLINEHGAYSFIKNTTPNLFSDKFKKQQPEKVSDLIERGKSFSKESLIQYYTAMMNRKDRTDVLKNNKLPVLFIIGAEDSAAPLHDLLQQVHLPKLSFIHILEGVGHMGIWEEPVQVNNFLLEFIRSSKM